MNVNDATYVLPLQEAVPRTYAARENFAAEAAITGDAEARDLADRAAVLHQQIVDLLEDVDSYLAANVMNGHPIDRLAGHPGQSNPYVRARPLLRLAVTSPHDLDALFGDQGETIALSTAAHLAWPGLTTERIIACYVALREACNLWAAFNGGAPAEELWPASSPWTAAEVDGEVLYILAELIHGTIACKACLQVAQHVGQMRPRMVGEALCDVHMVTRCSRCALVPCNPPVAAQVVVGRRGYCADCADKGSDRLLTVVQGGAS